METLRVTCPQNPGGIVFRNRRPGLKRFHCFSLGNGNEFSKAMRAMIKNGVERRRTSFLQTMVPDQSV